MQFVTVGVILLGVYQIMQGELTTGGLIACTIISGRAMAPLGQIAMLLSRYNQAMVALNSLNEIMNLPVEREKGKMYLSRPDIKGDIKFNKVSFSYPGFDVAAVDDVAIQNVNSEFMRGIAITGVYDGTRRRAQGERKKHLYKGD